MQPYQESKQAPEQAPVPQLRVSQGPNGLGVVLLLPFILAGDLAALVGGLGVIGWIGNLLFGGWQ